MCPFCISTVVSVAAGTITTAGLGALFAFARRIPEPPMQGADDDAIAESANTANDERV
ncbi:MAG: hypothetical protein ABI601_18170 [bacterium]